MATEWQLVHEVDESSVLAHYIQVAAFIRYEILQRALPVGTPLPSEQKLMDRYGVSRDTIRRAFATLRAFGIVTTRQGIGTTVAIEVTHEVIHVSHGARITMRLPAPDERPEYSLTLIYPLLVVQERGQPEAVYDGLITTVVVD